MIDRDLTELYGVEVTTQHPIENFSLIKHKLDFAYFHHHYKLFND